MRTSSFKSFALVALFFSGIATSDQNVKVSELGRFASIRENPLVGYGLVVGLAGTGDSARSAATIQSVSNALKNFGLDTDSLDVSSRNVAAVIVTAELPAFSEKGDRVNVKVSSVGDARSLAGGVLFMTPLQAGNGEIFALAQGQVSVGGYSFQSFDSRTQKNHPTVGVITDGATVERTIATHFATEDGKLDFILKTPNYQTVTAISEAINLRLPALRASPVHAGKLSVDVANVPIPDLFQVVSAINQIQVVPGHNATIVINERTGTIVSGGDARLAAVTIAHGSIKLTVDTNYEVSQPLILGRSPGSVETVVIPETKINVDETQAQSVSLKGGATVADLVDALRSIRVTTRDIIAILHSIKTAGALRAELIVE